MKFVSTRGQADAVSFSEAVAQGLAPDGGLYLPSEFPDITPFLPGMGEHELFRTLFFFLSFICH